MSFRVVGRTRLLLLAVATISLCTPLQSMAVEKAVEKADNAKDVQAESDKDTKTTGKQSKAKPDDKKSDKTKAADHSPALVNLNKATESQLESLPGMGPTYAKKVIAGRPYQSIDDLSKAGIPAATINKIRSQVALTDSPLARTAAKPIVPETTSSVLDVNKATEAQLQEVPGIGETYAKKIVAGRPYKSVDDLSKAGIPEATITKIKPLVSVGGVTTPPSKGMVWVNLESRKFHRETSKWYGKTKSGKYMTEADATKEGFTAAKRQ